MKVITSFMLQALHYILDQRQTRLNSQRFRGARSDFLEKSDRKLSELHSPYFIISLI